MVDAVSRNALSSLVRTQTSAMSAGIAALKSNSQATQAIIQELQKGLTDQNKPNQAHTSQQTATAMSGSPLPRGSLINIVV